ncbi:MAG: glycoside hydrolase family 5 protein [Panacibacter sp.]
MKKLLSGLFLRAAFTSVFFLTLACKKEGTPNVAINPPIIPPVDNPVQIDSTAVEYYGALKVAGNRIVGANDSPVQLRGMSFFWSQWMGKYYNQECVKWLKGDWHCNIVRAAMAVEEGGYLTNPDAEKQKVFALVDAAIEEGIYVIIDWHDHHATDHLEQSKAFFAEMAQKYGNKPNVIYEPFNEPLQVSWSSIKSYHQAVIDTIRKYDADNLIICGTPTWSQDVDVAANDPLTGTNIAYALHFYSGTHKQSLRDKATNALNKGIALMVTEYGTTDASGDGDVNMNETNLWYAFLDQNKISSCNWSIADKNESSAALTPGASSTGGWPANFLTTSGSFVRSEMKTKNLWFK